MTWRNLINAHRGRAGREFLGQNISSLCFFCSSVNPRKTQQQEVLRLYRSILRTSYKMPTINRQAFVRKKARHEFETNQLEVDPEKIKFQISLAETQLDFLLSQVAHLGVIFEHPQYHKT
mmetsp:Transcript_25763/g.41842  ORF Transcript_25763/g.41842 Transcript_25763/m.41842 type:complete len:120 (+) Transcript_25763:84-443(+)